MRFPHKPRPNELHKIYQDGFEGWIWNKEVEELWTDFCSSNRSIYDINPDLKGLSNKVRRALLFLAREKYDPGAYGLEPQTTGDCFPSGTYVLAENSAKIEDINIGDKVYNTYGELTTVVSTQKKISNKPLVSITPVGGLPLVCTEDHRILVYRLGKVGRKKITRPLYQRVIAKNEFSKSSVVSVYETRQEEWITAGELDKDDLLLVPLNAEVAQEPKEIPFNILDYASGRYFLGYFAGNGNEFKGTLKIDSPLMVYIESLSTAMSELGIRYKVEPKKKGVYRFVVHNAELARWIRKYLYNKDKSKNYPSFLLGDSDFLKGLWDADGSSKDKVHSLTSTSKSIIYGAYLTLIKDGYDPIISECTRSKGTYPNAKPLYMLQYRDNKAKQHIWRDDKYLCKPIKSIEYLEGPNEVYDIGVSSKEHSFIAEGYVVHNCTSHGSRNARDTSRSVEILNGDAELYYKRTATEPTYGARGHGGQGMDPYRAAKFETEYGFLFREKYTDSTKGISLDLSKYNANIGINWGRSGVPEKIKELCKRYNVGEWFRPKTKQEADDLLAAGKACHSGQQWGTSGQQPRDGINRKSEGWNHDMATVGYDFTRECFKEDVYFVSNSWAAWNEPNPVWLANQHIYGAWIPGMIVVPASEWEDYFLNSGSIHFYSQVNGFKIMELPSVITGVL